MSVARFFETMDAYFRAAASPAQERDEAFARLRQAHPGWEPSPSRLAIYGRFVVAHVRDTLQKNFPLTRGVVGEPVWAELVRAFYATDPARHFEINRLCESFPAFLADQVEARSLPPFVPALARFEWTDFEVYASSEEIPTNVSTLTANPTITVLQHPWRLSPWLRSAPRLRPASPEPGDETLLLWRHPVTHRTMYQAADVGALLVLKLAVEGLRAEDAAEAGGIPVEEVTARIQRAAEDGLVIAHSSGRHT
ncbi:MAG: putative DNA-binding domain-containing protein [Myxococcaceae bacterium]|nr:putative DNA-binding domain-containing protein [Myxococcaceae bacterium]